MIETTLFFTGLAALLAIKCAVRIAVDAGDFDGLPQASQID
ncbi:hypothetical protein [Belnapia moabensis]|nr:hypothetical protein [Belnapia moabensis]